MTALPRKSVTLKMVAEKANCSVSSVSTVLNNARGNSVVSSVTRKRIFAIAKELGYHPNFASQCLKTQRSRTIGIYVQPKKWSSLCNAYEVQIFRGIESMARERNYNVMLLNMSTGVLPDSCREQLLEKRVDGIMLIHTDCEVAETLAAEHPCVVAVDCAHGSRKINSVRFDDAAALRLAVDYLVEKGHTRIGYAGACTPEKQNSAPRERYFMEALRQNKLNVVEELIFNESKCIPPICYTERFCQEEGRRALHYFQTLSKPPTAVIAYNSLVAGSLLMEAVRCGLNIPDDLSIIGIDDYEYLDFLTPRLTVVDHVLEDMGRGGVSLLIDQIEQRNESVRSLLLQPKLKPGESVSVYLKSK